MTKFVGPRSQTYSYVTDNYIEENEAKGTKICFMKGRLETLS